MICLTTLANRAIDSSMSECCPRFFFRFLLDCAIGFSMLDRWYRHFVVLLDLKGYYQMCPAVTMLRTNLRWSWRNLSTILGQVWARNFPYCTDFPFFGQLCVVFDHWPTYMNIRALRRACPTTGVQACPQGFVQSRRAQGRERKVLLPHLFALHQWL